MGEAYENTFTQAASLDWYYLVRSTEAVAYLAPYAILAPFVGLVAGYAVARFVEEAGMARQRRAYQAWAKRTWR
jgi:hypothetical protein